MRNRKREVTEQPGWAETTGRLKAASFRAPDTKRGAARHRSTTQTAPGWWGNQELAHPGTPVHAGPEALAHPVQSQGGLLGSLRLETRTLSPKTGQLTTHAPEPTPQEQSGRSGTQPPAPGMQAQPRLRRPRAVGALPALPLLP